MQIKILAEGGAMKPGPALSQKLGPAGINMGQVISKINEATSNFRGMKVPVELEIDSKTKEFEVKVFSPPVSELLKKELGVEKGSGMQNDMKIANASIEQIIKVAKTKLPNLLCNDLKSAVKTVAGSCVSLGILIENKSPVEVEEEIDEGKYDKEISNEITETPEEKKKELSEFFSKIKSIQDKKLKAAKAAKEAEDAKKEAKAARAEATKTGK
ncbi:50S ribosomal protein L11 [Candidatus Pacearchaeota archaeon ex4484_71]|nr:MAG: 50S ribosomal protein L11 [Candidatus Pacearchaeota archaeon ex4484_71]